MLHAWPSLHHPPHHRPIVILFLLVSLLLLPAIPLRLLPLHILSLPPASPHLAPDPPLPFSLISPLNLLSLLCAPSSGGSPLVIYHPLSALRLLVSCLYLGIPLAKGCLFYPDRHFLPRLPTPSPLPLASPSPCLVVGRLGAMRPPSCAPTGFPPSPVASPPPAACPLPQPPWHLYSPSVLFPAHENRDLDFEQQEFLFVGRFIYILYYIIFNTNHYSYSPSLTF